MSARQLLRFDFLDGRTVWRPLINLDHGTLCAQASLDVCSYFFDLPASARGTGSASAGYGGLRGGRKVNGYIMHGPSKTPVGTITFATEGERFREFDPQDAREALRLD
jgi:hypothetical protein